MDNRDSNINLLPVQGIFVHTIQTALCITYAQGRQRVKFDFEYLTTENFFFFFFQPVLNYKNASVQLVVIKTFCSKYIDCIMTWNDL